MRFENKLTVHDRVVSTLQGHRPDHIPFINRMDFWFNGLTVQQRIPERFRNMDLFSIHRQVGIGQEEWFSPCAYKYRNVELLMYREGQKILQINEPEISFFPDL